MDELVVEGVEKRLGGAVVLHGVSFALRRGEVVALLGPSGSGKTTLLRAIAGLDHPDAGRIALGGETLFDAAAGAAVPAERRRMGLVFQSYALWPHRTVQENVAYGLRLRRTPAAEIRDRVAAVLRQLGLEGLAARRPHELSGGQQQRVALARALVYEPRLLLLDEPLSNLDAKLREEARAWLRALIDGLHLSAVLVTHDQMEALALADRVVLLSRGRVEQDAPPRDIYDRPATLFAAEFMGAANRMTGIVAEVRDGRARLAGAGFDLWGELRIPRRPGDAATGVVRVERVRVPGAPGEPGLDAALEAALYLGERWDYAFRSGELRLRARGSAALERGTYRLAIAPESLWIF